MGGGAVGCLNRCSRRTPRAGRRRRWCRASTISRPAPELPSFGNRAVSLIEAYGNVVMQQGNKKARSKKALYYQQDDKLILTGEPEAWEQGYRVTGVKMTMFLKEERSIVEGSRVVINEAESGNR